MEWNYRRPVEGESKISVSQNANHTSVFKALWRGLTKLNKASHAVLLQMPDQSVIRRLTDERRQDVPETRFDPQQAKQTLESQSPSQGTIL